MASDVFRVSDSGEIPPLAPATPLEKGVFEGRKYSKSPPWDSVKKINFVAAMALLMGVTLACVPVIGFFAVVGIGAREILTKFFGLHIPEHVTKQQQEENFAPGHVTKQQQAVSSEPEPEARVSMNQAHLGAETEEITLISAREIDEKKTHEENFADLLKKVEEAANRDLLLDEAYIEDKFKIGEALSNFSPEQIQQKREELRTVINRALAVRELKQQGKLATGESDEMLLLGFLEDKDSKKKPLYQDQDKEAIYDLIQYAITNLKKEDYQNPVVDFKNILKRIAFQLRLNPAYLNLTTALQIQKFELAQKMLKSVNERLSNLAMKYPLKLPDSFPLKEGSPNLKLIQSRFETYKKGRTDSFVEDIFRTAELRKAFSEETLSLEDFEKKVQQHIDDKIANNTKNLDRALNRQGLRYASSPAAHLVVEKNDIEVDKIILFFQKWGKDLTAEMVQGLEDVNEDLGEGVCYGLCQLLQIDSIKNPDLSLEELSKRNTIGPDQRRIQGTYIVASKLQGIGLLPIEVAHRYGVEEKGVSIAIDRPKLFQSLNNEAIARGLPPLQEDSSETKEIISQVVKDAQVISQVEKEITIESGQFMESFQAEMSQGDWSASQGWIRLNLLGENHTIAIRLDEKNNKIWLFDANIGFFAFEKSDVSFAESRNQCFDCLKDIFNLKYQKIYALGISCLHRYQPDSGSIPSAA